MDTVDFFNEEDFIEIRKFAGQSKSKDNPEMLKTYDYLKGTYNKIECWAQQVQAKVFPSGEIHILKKPTNQANIFQEYQWAKLYPDDRSFDLGKLAFTMGIETVSQFNIKIDTVGLGDRDKTRQQYVKERDDPNNPSIIRTFKSEDILKAGWDNLIDISVKSIRELKQSYDKMLASLFGDEMENVSEEKSIESISLNTILYGPPGTGKTYKTIVKAISIANPKFKLKNEDGKEISRKEIKQEYARLVSENQISFVSFHQSMSYEDFIEGIKPQKPQPNEPLKYDVEDGIFKLISKRAQSNYDLSKVSNSEVLPFEEAFQSLKDEWENNQELKFPLKTKGYDFTIIGFTNTSIQFRKASGGTSHTLSINTLGEQYYGKEYNFKQGVGIYYPAILAKLKTYKSDKLRTDKITGDFKNYVLIIDEINRGNISQIFGELITLIEADKRAGMPEALSVTLPYSKDELFSVPPNLYIIGTMNTADRSVEALDTALRRRFSFEFMPPMDSLIADDLEGVALRTVFNQMNERISFLLDADHQIGHSYIMKVKELDELNDVFKNKIIPLLREYFFNDFRKIHLVLGDGFIKKANYRPKFAVSDNEEMARDVYSFLPIDETFDIKEALNNVIAK
jgi:5-methylcytosine-specific restriction enzyme B